MKEQIGVLISGRGSNFEALAASVGAGRIPNAEIAIVLSNREDAPGLERARARGIPARGIASKGLEREVFDRQIVAALEEKKVDLVCLAGYMRLLSPYFVRAFPNRILNIHPSLLPAFPGLEAQRQALEHGVKFTGAQCILWTRSWMPAESSCRRLCRSRTATRSTRFPRAFCARSTGFTRRR